MISGGLRGVKESTGYRFWPVFVITIGLANFVTLDETRAIFRASFGKSWCHSQRRINLPVGSNVKSVSHSSFIATFSNINSRPPLAARRFPF